MRWPCSAGHTSSAFCQMATVTQSAVDLGARSPRWSSPRIMAWRSPTEGSSTSRPPKWDAGRTRSSWLAIPCETTSVAPRTRAGERYGSTGTDAIGPTDTRPMPKFQTSWSSQRLSELSRHCRRLRMQGHRPNVLNSAFRTLFQLLLLARQRVLSARAFGSRAVGILRGSSEHVREGDRLRALRPWQVPSRRERVVIIAG